jgi:hypothetical protein
MIYVAQKSKKTARKKLLKLELNDAKDFLYNLSFEDFRAFSYYIYAQGDNYFCELEEIKRFFADDFFKIKENNTQTYEILIVNEELPKKDRLRIKGASVNSLNNFKDKLEKMIPYSTIRFVYGLDVFSIYIDHIVGSVKIVCNYQLKILESYGYNEGKYVNIKSSDNLVKIVNKLFRRQRFYYKKEGDKNE